MNYFKKKKDLSIHPLFVWVITKTSHRRVTETTDESQTTTDKSQKTTDESQTTTGESQATKDGSQTNAVEPQTITGNTNYRGVFSVVNMV